MRTKKIHVLVCCALLALVSISCVKDVDFDQAEDVVLTPVYEVDFIYSRIDTGEFIDLDLDPSIIIPSVTERDTLNYDLFGTDFVIDHLERVELSFEFSNTIQRDFTFILGFLDEAEQRIGPTYTLVANAGNGEGTEPVLTTETIILDNATINILSPTQKIITAVTVENLNSGLGGVIEVKSKGTYFINYDL